MCPPSTWYQVIALALAATCAPARSSAHGAACVPVRPRPTSVRGMPGGSRLVDTMPVSVVSPTDRRIARWPVGPIPRTAAGPLHAQLVGELRPLPNRPLEHDGTRQGPVGTEHVVIRQRRRLIGDLMCVEGGGHAPTLTVASAPLECLAQFTLMHHRSGRGAASQPPIVPSEDDCPGRGGGSNSIEK